MFTIKGHVKIIFSDAETGIVRDIVEQDNIITDNTFRSFINSDSPRRFDGSIISISTSQATPNLRNSTVPNIIGTGYIPPTIISPIWVDGNPPYGQIQNRILQTGSDRTFNTVALTSLGGNENTNIQNTSTTDAHAYLLLDSPCTQKATEVLDIFYRIQFLNTDGEGIYAPGFASEFGRYTFGFNNTGFLQHLSTSLVDAPDPTKYTKPAITRATTTNINHLIVVDNSISADLNFTTKTSIPTHFKRKRTRTGDLDYRIGYIMNSMYHMYNQEGSYAYSWAEGFPGLSKLQGVFFKRPGASRPFFDPPEAGRGTGSVSVTLPNNTWTSPTRWPTQYKIEFQGTGEVGTATYRLKTAISTGYVGNTSTNANCLVPYRNNTAQAFPDSHGHQTANMIRYSDTEIVQWDSTGVTILNLKTGDYKNYSSNSPLFLAAQNIGQVILKDNILYIADRTFGLFRIDTQTDIVEILNQTACYGVGIDNQNRIIAAFEGRFSISPNLAVALPFTNANITPNNWSRIRYIQVDPTNSNTRLIIVYANTDNTGNTGRGTLWYDIQAGLISPGPTSSIPVINTQSIKCNNSGVWIMSRAAIGSHNNALVKITFGQTGVTEIGRGADIPINFPTSNTVMTTLGLTNVTTGAQTLAYESPLISPSTFGLVYLTRGLYMTGSYLCVVKIPDINEVTYLHTPGVGWLENTGQPKITHLASEPLIDGLQIAFNNGENPISFIAGDFYNIYCCDGLWKDNASTFTYTYDFYSKPVKFKQPISSTVPSPIGDNLPTLLVPVASNPDFVVLETDEVRYHKFILGGVPVTNITVDGNNPAPGAIDISSNGTLRFNVSDVGKSLSGTYAYVKDQPATESSSSVN